MVGGAMAVEIDLADVRVEWRRAGVGEIEPQLEPPRQLHHAGEIGDLCEVIAERAAVFKPIVEIESAASIGSSAVGSSGARIGIRAEDLKAVRKALIGPQ